MNDEQNQNSDGNDQVVPDFLDDTPLPWEDGGSPQPAAPRPDTSSPAIRTSLAPPQAPRLPSSGNERTGTGSAHPMTRISEEARAMMEEARQKRTVTDRLTRKGRELIQHEEKLMRVLYRGREKGLEYVVEAECQALREVCNAWLAINGTRLETDTRVFIIAERERLEEVLAAYASRYYAKIARAFNEMDRLTDLPELQTLAYGRIQDSMRAFQSFCDQVNARFLEILNTRV